VTAAQARRHLAIKAEAIPVCGRRAVEDGGIALQVLLNNIHMLLEGREINAPAAQPAFGSGPHHPAATSAVAFGGYNGNTLSVNYGNVSANTNYGSTHEGAPTNSPYGAAPGGAQGAVAASSTWGGPHGQNTTGGNQYGNTVASSHGQLISTPLQYSFTC
jgi:hypothetical protein